VISGSTESVGVLAAANAAAGGRKACTARRAPQPSAVRGAWRVVVAAKACQLHQESSALLALASPCAAERATGPCDPVTV
jgi:hypothetical protein